MGDDDNKKKFKEATRANPILGKLERLQPDIFKTGLIKKPNITKENIGGEFEAYSRLCQSGNQPVILTEDEKTNIVANNPNLPPTDILEYSPDPTKKISIFAPDFGTSKKVKH